MTPRELDRYRKTTDQVVRFSVSKTQRCPACNVRRSINQFDGKKCCRKCRGK